MDPRQILQLYDHEMRRDPPPGQAQIFRHPGLTYVAEPPPSPFRGWVIYTRLDESTVNAAIQSVIEFYRPSGGEFEWKTYDHDTPADLKQRLERAGFIPRETEGLLALDLEDLPARLEAPESALSVDVRQVSDLADLNHIVAIENEVWNEPDSDRLDYLANEMQQFPDRIRFYLAYADGRPVSCAWIRFYPKRSFAELYGGSTLEAYRGRGMYRALVAARTVEARRRGVRFLAVDASPMSRPILERIGFKFLVYTQPFEWKYPPGEDA